MLKKILAATLLTLVFTAGAAFAADIMLPTPEKEGGMPVFEALSNRSSAKADIFDNKEIPLKELSTLLWAATGKNRDKGWTVPMAMGSEPYINIYVLLKNGVFEYNWEKNMLMQISERNMIERAGRQEFLQTVPCVFVFATKGAGPRKDSWAEVAVGAMSQNVYLAAESLGLKARYMASFNNESLLSVMEMNPLSRIISIMPVGYQK